MKSKKLQQAKSLRFRRWSRAGYAIFCSLACSVTIGCVAISISDKSLQKAVGTCSSSYCLNNSESESPDKLKEQADLKLAIQQLQDTILLEKTFESAAACSLKTYFLLNQTVEVS
ncbi:MAG: hypothetical protein P4L34_05035 [Paludibacter sp.]|nr:hypothetical protein [Paludibacter sp.]